MITIHYDFNFSFSSFKFQVFFFFLEINFRQLLKLNNSLSFSEYMHMITIHYKRYYLLDANV